MNKFEEDFDRMVEEQFQLIKKANHEAVNNALAFHKKLHHDSKCKEKPLICESLFMVAVLEGLRQKIDKEVQEQSFPFINLN